MGKELSDFWQAAQQFRAAKTEDTKHGARVMLLRIALENNNKLGERAAELLRTEGLAVIRDTHTLTTRAI